MNNACPFCNSQTRPSVRTIGLDVCITCGCESDFVLRSRMERMSPKARLNFIGYYHATNGWCYGWRLPAMTRSETRSYAQGFLSAPDNRGKRKRELCFDGQRARKDAAYLGCFWL